MIISEDKTALTLKATRHNKLAIIHCGVIRKGFRAIGSDPRDATDGEEIQFERVGLRAKRNGSESIFTKES